MSDLTTHVFGAQHAEIAELITDGATPVYGTPLDIPGIKSINATVSSKSEELRGDNGPLVKETLVENIEVEIEFAKWDARIYALVTGATLTVEVDGSYSVSYEKGAVPKEFSLRGQAASATGGAAVEVFYPKLKISNVPDMVGLSEETFKTVTLTCDALPNANGQWFDFSFTL